MNRKTKNCLLFFIVISLSIILYLSLFSKNNYDLDASEKDLKAFNGSGLANSNFYIREFVIPTPASKPIGITVDSSGMIWFAETRLAKIGKFDPFNETFEEYDIPVKDPAKNAPEVWGMIFDSNDNLWFTDSNNNAIWKFSPENQEFKKYGIPTENAFPVQIAIDSKGIIWFTEVYGNNLGKLDPEELKSGKSAEIIELQPPGSLELLGGLAIDENDDIWFPMLTYPIMGKLVKYDNSISEFEVFDLPKNVRSPVGISIDSSGIIWISDHGTSLFMSFDPRNNYTESYSTSITTTGFPISLPYWSYIDRDGIMWFNEHQGNKIASYDSVGKVLTEYSIPTRNPIWGNISNPLQLTIAPDGRIWFTEWSENKIAVINTEREIPFIIETSTPNIELNPGDNTTIKITITSDRLLNGPMEFRTSGTFTPSGKLQNITVHFDNNTIDIDDQSVFEQKIFIQSEVSLEPGQYTLMIGVSFKDITKLIPLTISITK